MSVPKSYLNCLTQFLDVKSASIWSKYRLPSVMPTRLKKSLSVLSVSYPYWLFISKFVFRSFYNVRPTIGNREKHQGKREIPKGTGEAIG